MALSPVTIHSGVTLASAATWQAPVHTTGVLPVKSSSIVGNAMALNFIITTPSDVTCGPNATIVFKYGFSSTSYTAANAPTTIVNIKSINLTVPNALSATADYTTSAVIPITGNYFYCWLDLSDFKGPLTSGFTSAAVPIAISTAIDNP
jgi:hypothetical protein